MSENTLKALMTIMDMPQQRGRSFQSRLRHIICRVVECMQSERGSIILLRGRKTLEVVASTVPDLVGIKQPLAEDSPSAWVYKNKRILYVAPGIAPLPACRRQSHYKKEAFLVAPIMSNGRVIGLLSITEKKGDDAFSVEEQELFLAFAGQIISAIEHQRLTENLSKKRQELVRKNMQLKKLEKIRTDLFNMLVHDLKGPISEVVGNLDILSYVITDDNLEYVQAAQSSCDTLFRMISDLLDITRLEEGTLPLILERIEPHDLIHEAVLRLNGMAGARGVTLREDLPADGVAPDFTGDRGILLRVMQNLLVNAVQHSPTGSSVTAGYDADGQEVRLWVKDDGPGIAPQYQDAIFDKFFQISRKRDGRRYSTGLGLTFCKMAMEAHHGTIQVESDGQTGSRFILSLPI
ncbi:MAG: ATP-binding protein [Syntrophaceae bacterium]